MSDTDVSASPAIQIISPAFTVFTGILSVPSYLNNFVNRPDSTLSPERLIALTLSLTFAEPCSTRPTKHLPKYLSDASKVLLNNLNNSANVLITFCF